MQQNILHIFKYNIIKLVKDKLVKDKLFVNNQPIKGKFESNRLDHITTDAIDYNHIQHTLPRTVKNGVFQGHYQSVHTQMEASQVLRSCYQGDTAKSDHIIYAYRLIDVKYIFSCARKKLRLNIFNLQNEVARVFSEQKMLFDIKSQQIIFNKRWELWKNLFV